jgi:hypothetical protein
MGTFSWFSMVRVAVQVREPPASTDEGQSNRIETAEAGEGFTNSRRRTTPVRSSATPDLALLLSIDRRIPPVLKVVKAPPMARGREGDSSRSLNHCLLGKVKA